MQEADRLVTGTSQQFWSGNHISIYSLLNHEREEGCTAEVGHIHFVGEISDSILPLYVQLDLPIFLSKFNNCWILLLQGGCWKNLGD